MTNNDEHANVIDIIPYQSLRTKHCRRLGDACSDYVLEGEIKHLFRLVEKRIISHEELIELCEEAIERRVNGGVSARYVRELEGLMNQHRVTYAKKLTTAGEEGTDLVCLGAKYDQLSLNYLPN